jgi:hypothetical protein
MGSSPLTQVAIASSALTQTASANSAPVAMASLVPTQPRGVLEVGDEADE